MTQEKRGAFNFEGSNGKFAQELITAGKTFEEALGRTVFRTERQKVATILLKQHLEEFGLTQRINGLTDLMNAAAAVDGVGRRQALQSDIGIYEPNSAGGKLTKQQYEQTMQAQRKGQDQNNQQPSK